MSLLHEIQNDLTSASGDVVGALRKCKILAARLSSDELARWVDFELDGYPEDMPVPNYRRLHASCYANFQNQAWRVNKTPVLPIAVPEEFRDRVDGLVEFRSGIEAAMAFVEEGATIEDPYLAIVLQRNKVMYPALQCVSAWKEISAPEFKQFISTVKNRLLGFVLRIEGENPAAGEAAINSRPVAPEKLQPLVNNYFGPVGAVAQHSHDFTQTANIASQSQLATLVAEMSSHLDELNLDGHQRQKAEAQIATLKAQLTDEPDPVIVQQAGRTLRNVTEGAIASLIATAAQPTVWHTIQNLLALFPHK